MFRSKRLNVERLETKALLACDVMFDGALLDIQCDGEDDLVSILTVNNALTVDTGNGGVDLGSSENLSDINVNSGRGDDNVVITGVDVSGSINVKTGRGADRVFMSVVNAGDDLKIRTGRGADRVTLSGTNVADKVKVKTGADDDIVEVLAFGFFGGLTAGDDVKIDGKDGIDTLLGQENIVAGDSDDLDIDNFELFE